MKKHSNVAQNAQDNILETSLSIAQAEKMSIEDMPLTTLREYRVYNEEARKLNKKLRLNRYPMKQCPVELHPHQRVVFRRNDQPTNDLPVFLSDDMIHFDKKLTPGREYDLPEYIVHYLAGLGNPVWGWVDLPDGSRETRVLNKIPRFSLTTVYRD